MAGIPKNGEEMEKVEMGQIGAEMGRF